jgi:hypothetical protein
MDKPYYPNKPIGSVDTLAKKLGVNPRILLDISKKTDNSYTEILIFDKNQKQRTVYDPKHELKKIQKRINSRIFESILVPKYLQGSLKEDDFKRDYVENARIHNKANTLIKLDIKRFFDNIRSERVKDIFLYLFKFPEDVSEILTNITTFRGKVPQGACTSSYIANFIFFNSEYALVSNLRSKGLSYSRLLDDVTISSQRELDDLEITESIRATAAMFKKHGLRMNNSKQCIEHKSKTKNNPDAFRVTGVWTTPEGPKVRRHDRRVVRQQVFTCENMYATSPYSEDYHKLWNKTSGLVAQLKRMNHKQSHPLRVRLSKILPKYDEKEKNLITLQVKKCLKANRRTANRYGFHIKIGRLQHKINILSRTEKSLACSLRQQLNAKFGNIPSRKEYWND